MRQSNKRTNLLKAQVTFHYNADGRHSGAFYELVRVMRNKRARGVFDEILLSIFF